MIARSANKPPSASIAKPASPSLIDFGKPFLPERLTPLFFTPVYATLNERQRLRYNQMQALYLNEQIVFFETAVGTNMLDALAHDPSLGHLQSALRQFAA